MPGDMGTVSPVLTLQLSPGGTCCSCQLCPLIFSLLEQSLQGIPDSVHSHSTRSTFSKCAQAKGNTHPAPGTATGSVKFPKKSKEIKQC